MNGILYVVSTPIGNLEDITLRALKILNDVDIIACEDTRTTKKLLNYYNIKKPLTSYHEHNEKLKADKIVIKLKEGLNIALVTDSGTPVISDPGYNLIKLSINNNINVIPIPGATALITALSISCLQSVGFVFLGFLPRTKKKTYDLLTILNRFPYTLIFYESPKRIVKTLKYIYKKLGDRTISVSRELTKLHEETIRGRVSEVIKALDLKNTIKGEFVIVIEGNSSLRHTEDSIEPTLLKLKAHGKSLSESVQISNTLLNEPKSKIYKIALKLWQKK